MKFQKLGDLVVSRVSLLLFLFHCFSYDESVILNYYHSSSFTQT